MCTKAIYMRTETTAATHAANDDEEAYAFLMRLAEALARGLAQEDNDEDLKGRFGGSASEEQTR